MKKFILAALVTVTAALSFAAPSQAGGRYWHHGHRWHGGPGYGLVFNVGPTYVDDEDYCYSKKVRKYDRYGNLYVKRVTICE